MVDFNKDLVLKEPEKWMTLESAMDYVNQTYQRHWSKSYIYTLMRKNQLNSYKMGILLNKEEVDNVVNNFKRQSPPLMRKVTEEEVVDQSAQN